MTNVVGTQTLLDSGACRPRHREVRARLHRRGLRLDRAGQLGRGAAAAAQLAVLRLEGRQRPARPRLPPHPRAPVCITRCSNNYGPYQFPEKVIPLFVTNLIDGARCRCTARAPTCATGCTSTTTAGHPPRARGRPAGRGLQHRRRHRADQQGAHRAAARGDRHRLGPGPAVTDRLGHDLRYSVDITKISAELGYQPQVPFEQGWPRPSSGTAPTASGGSRSRPGPRWRSD